MDATPSELGADYLRVNRVNWDARADVHYRAGYGVEKLLSSPTALSDVVRFDRSRLGPLEGLDVLHLQCHLGTDTLSLSRLGASTVTGLDLSGGSLARAREIARTAGASIDFVEADVYTAPAALSGRTFDLVYTGIGALCWLPDIARWGRTVAQLLRPGGRLFVRDAHPMLNTLTPVVVRDSQPESEGQPWLTAPGGLVPAAEYPYFEGADPLVWRDALSYYGSEPVANPLCVEWSHGLAEIVMATVRAGLEINDLVEHDSVPWNALPGLMTEDPDTGEFRLTDRPERVAASFTLIATRR